MKNPKKESGKFKKSSSFLFWILRRIFGPVLYLLYRFKFDKKTSKGIKRPCIILANHQTLFDQFAVGLGFSFGINYVASDIIFRYGLKSKIMAVLSRPIPFSKGNSDFIAVKNIMSVIKDGGSVGMFPSGNRSFYGEESTIISGIGKLVKKLKVPLVLVQLRGGFNTLPRWKTRPSRGKMSGCVTKIIKGDELSVMSDDEVDRIIRKELSFNEFEYNRKAKIVFHGRHKAEFLESMLFYCPCCGCFNGLYSKANDFYCRNCGAWARINSTGFFEKIEKAQAVPETILEWSYKQLNFIKSFDFKGFTSKPVFSDNDIAFYKAERAKKELFLGKGKMEFFTDRIAICGYEFLFTGTTMAVQGVRKLTIYNGENVYAALAPLRTNLAKYMICGYHLRNKALNITEEYYGY